MCKYILHFPPEHLCKHGILLYLLRHLLQSVVLLLCHHAAVHQILYSAIRVLHRVDVLREVHSFKHCRGILHEVLKLPRETLKTAERVTGVHLRCMCFHSASASFLAFCTIFLVLFLSVIESMSNCIFSISSASLSTLCVIPSYFARSASKSAIVA